MRLPALACPPMNSPIFWTSSIGGFSPASVRGSFLCMIMKRMVVSSSLVAVVSAGLGGNQDERAQARAAQHVSEPEDRPHRNGEPERLAGVNHRGRGAAEVGGHQQRANELRSRKEVQQRPHAK